MLPDVDQDFAKKGEPKVCCCFFTKIAKFSPQMQTAIVIKYILVTAVDGSPAAGRFLRFCIKNVATLTPF